MPQAGEDVAPGAHPLDPLTVPEMRQAVDVLRGEGWLTDTTRLAELSLHEPSKDVLASFSPGDRIERSADAIVHLGARGLLEATISLDPPLLVTTRIRTGVQSAITPTEFVECERVVREHPAFIAALGKRGITDPSKVMLEAWGTGGHSAEGHAGKRLAWTPCWFRDSEADNPYSRPIEGLYAIVDLNEMSVLEIEDHGVEELPAGGGRYGPEDVGGLRTDLRPFDITQPEGPSFDVDGWEVRWQKWRFRIGFTAREGLVLHCVAYEDGDRVRDVLHRASCSELIVPYGDPSPGGYRKNAFDVGEYGLGPLTNSLELGCDCLGEIRYFDVDLCDDSGEPYSIKNAVCLHEEDSGLLWKHYDSHTDHAEVRRSRRLVISSIMTLANYEYAFYWYLYQDGTIGFEVGLTGIVITSGAPEKDANRHATTIMPGVLAPFHQHFFTMRLDLDIDGPGNVVQEVDTVATPIDDHNPHGVAFETRERDLRREGEGERNLDPSAARFWRVVNRGRTNSLGSPVSYRIVPGANVLPFAATTADVLQRAPFLRSPLWVTRNDPAERYPAGDYPNQGDGTEGLVEWVKADRDIEDEDLVVWYTIGSHHIPRVEDWPVMPMDRAGFMLRPDGFFDASPALDVPPSDGHGHCATT